MSTYSSQFFVPSQVAIGQDTTKATVGLGLDLPAEVLAATTRLAPMVGLGISGDLLWFEFVESSRVASPPMLAPRRSPRRPQIVDSPATEFAPMHTPSSSLRGFADAVPPTPSLKCSPAFPRAVGLGIDLLGLDALELALSFQENACYPAATGVGLGFGLPCLNGAELITTLEPQSTSQDGVVVDLSFLDVDAAACTSPTDFRTDALENCAHPEQSRPMYGLGFELSEVGMAQGASSLCKGPTLGFDSPFWAQYASAMQEL